jgi:hypothetical protein
MSNTRLLSGRAIKRTGLQLSTDRYDYLDLSNAEPDLGNPTVNGSVLVSTVTGQRSWSDALTVSPSGTITLGNLTVTGPSEFEDLLVKGKLTVIGDIVGGPLRTDDIEIVGNRIRTTQSNSNFEVDTVGTGSIELLTDTNVTGTITATTVATNQIVGPSTNGNINITPNGSGLVVINSDKALKLPLGSTLQRPVGQEGLIRFNSTNKSFEGYDGTVWFALGSQGGTGVNADFLDGLDSSYFLNYNNLNNRPEVAFRINGDDSVQADIPIGGNFQVIGRGGTQTYVDTSGDLNIESRTVTVKQADNTVVTPNLASIKFTGPGVTVSGTGDDVTVNINIGGLYNLGANIDGGAVESIYLFTQNLDGGVPYTNYAQTGTLDAGGVV